MVGLSRYEIEMDKTTAEDVYAESTPTQREKGADIVGHVRATTVA